MIKKDYQVKSPNGLSSRSSTALVNLSNHYKCDLFLLFNEEEANLKSIMNVMSLVIHFNESFSIKAIGSDEQIAIQKLEELMKDLKLI